MANPTNGIFPDSSFWISYLWTADSNHAAALALAEELGLGENRVYLNHYSIGEPLNFLTYRGGRALSQRFLSVLGALDTRFVDSGVENYLQAFERTDRKVAFSDVAIVFDAVRFGGELLSFDKQQVSIYKALLPSR